MTAPGARVPSVCPRCYHPVTAKMPQVLTTEGSYHHRCYLQVRQPRRGAVAASRRRAQGSAPASGDRLTVLLERLAQIVFILILIGTGLILLEHALP